MQSSADAGENRTSLRAGFVAHRDHAGKERSGFKEARHAFGFVIGNIHAHFPHGFDHDGIELAGFNTRAFGGEFLTADLIQKRLGHLAAGAVMNANEQYPFLRGSHAHQVFSGSGLTLVGRGY